MSVFVIPGFFYVFIETINVIWEKRFRINAQDQYSATIEWFDGSVLMSVTYTGPS